MGVQISKTLRTASLDDECWHCQYYSFDISSKPKLSLRQHVVWSESDIVNSYILIVPVMFMW